MANYRPKSLSELNNVYDKAMRAEKAIKEGSGMLSATENETTPQSENIFTELESKASEADRNQVFDPDITNIANDFLKRYAKSEQPTVVPKEVRRPAPSIQSVYHTPVKHRQQAKSDVSLNPDNNSAVSPEVPPVPLHKPAPTMPAIQPPVRETEEPSATAATPANESEIQENTPVQTKSDSTPAAEPKIAVVPPVVAKAEPSPSTSPNPYIRPRNASSRTRITSTERSELMEEYLRVMSDDDDEPTHKKSKFSFFRKKKKYDEEYDEDTSESLYDEIPEEENSADEVPVVPFDNSQVRYTDEYSDTAEENMGIDDYIKADFDYDDNEEDDTLDVSTSFPKNSEEDIISEEVEELTESQETPEESEESHPEDIVTVEAEPTAQDIDKYPADEETDFDEETEDIVYEEPSEGTEEVVLPVEEEQVTVIEETTEEDQEAVTEADTEAIAETDETAEDVVYPTEEPSDEAPCEAPASDMVFEDIFSVSDESKRSHTGGNWEEVFGEEFASEASDETEPEVIIPDEADETPETAEVEYEPQESAEFMAYEEAAEDEYDYAAEDSETKKAPESKGALKILLVVACVISIICASATLVLSSLSGVNTGKLISDKYRLFSISEDLAAIGLVKGDLILTENAYAHTDDLYVFKAEETDNYNFGKVTSGSLNLKGDYIYVTQTNNGTSRINRDKSMGVVIATYSGIGSVLSAICEYYIFIAGAFLIIAIASIVGIILTVRKKAQSDDTYDYTDYSDYDDTDNSGSDTDDENDEFEDEYYDYDTDGIEQGLFSGI